MANKESGLHNFELYHQVGNDHKISMKRQNNVSVAFQNNILVRLKPVLNFI